MILRCLSWNSPVAGSVRAIWDAAGTPVGPGGDATDLFASGGQQDVGVSVTFSSQVVAMAGGGREAHWLSRDGGLIADHVWDESEEDDHHDELDKRLGQHDQRSRLERRW